MKELTNSSPFPGASRPLVVTLLALGVHVAAGLLDEHRVVLFPNGHGMILVLAMWILTFAVGIAALVQTRGRSWTGWVACALGLVGAGLIVFAPSGMI
jgi:hypothetical protein